MNKKWPKDETIGFIIGFVGTSLVWSVIYKIYNK